MILVINLGSSSLRFNLFDESSDLFSVCNGICENIGFQNSEITFKYHEKLTTFNIFLKNHKEAFRFVKKILFSSDGPIKNLNDICAIGHRVVHGGEYFSKPTLINEDVVKKIKKLIPLAPIHNSVNLEGILDCQIEFPNVPQFAVFDTSFFQKLPEKVKIYPIPHDLAQKYKIKKYGFHGISHSWAHERYKKLSKKSKFRAISCHLGSGSSICAVDENGAPVETSMGLTPLGGLMMGTRSGSLDPSVVTYLISQSGMSCFEVGDILNKKSGLLGVSNYSNDVRKLLNKKDYKSNLALDMFIHRIVKCIGGYIAVLQGVEAIIFTGGIGENSPEIREKICENFKFLGVKIDKNLNSKTTFETERIISGTESDIDICIVKANEEFSIASSVMKRLKDIC